MQPVNVKLDCTQCEQRLLEAHDLEGTRQDPPVAAHLADCSRCADFLACLKDVKGHLDGYRVREPSEELIQGVLARSRGQRQKALQVETVPSMAILFRVVLAGLAALPVVLLINTALGWALYEIAVYVLPRTAAFYCMALFVAWATLGTSLSYASLPFLSLLAGKQKALSGLEETR